MPTDLFAGASGGHPYWFDGAGNHTWASVGTGGTSTVWDLGVPRTLTSVLVEWHYGGAYNNDGSAGSVSGAAGPMTIEGSADGSTGWTSVVTDANPALGHSYPGDFSITYTFAAVTWRYYRFRSTSGSAANDMYTLAAYGPETGGRTQAFIIG